jgi:hypothetical protein
MERKTIIRTHRRGKSIVRRHVRRVRIIRASVPKTWKDYLKQQSTSTLRKMAQNSDSLEETSEIIDEIRSRGEEPT